MLHLSKVIRSFNIENSKGIILNTNAKKELWIRLKDYRFGNLVPPSMAHKIQRFFGSTDAFTHAFAAKVARKHGWTNEFAFLAVREYKKFVFLGVVSHYEVTPSVVIDKVWHEHQLFNAAYRDFCANVLRHRFDHVPELLALDEQVDVFNAQYRKTLAFYEHEFGVAPPPEIWDRPKFDPKTVRGLVHKPGRKNDMSSDSSSFDIPLYTMFQSESDAAYAPIPVNISGGGGDFGGAGAQASWPASHSSSPAPDTDTESITASGCSSSSSDGGGGCGS